MRITAKPQLRFPVRRRLQLAAAAGILALWTPTVRAQTSTTATTGANGAPATGSTTATPGQTGTYSPGVNGAVPSIGGPRPIFLSGVVMTDDGSRLPGNVNIQSICGPVQRTMAHATESGEFGFEWANTSASFGDASQTRRTSGGGGASLTGSRTGSRGMDPLANCDLTAESPGYSSSKVSLYDRGGQDNFDVGVIVLHLIAAGEGYTVSVLALQAPKAARKSFEKGTSLAAANKPADALANFKTAVTIYPQYADAWLSMGKIQWRLGRKDEAHASFGKAMDLDNKLVGPWQELGYLACDEAKWADAVRYLDQAVHLDPIDSPAPWYFSALANYNLGQFEQAERSIRAEMKLDRGKNAQPDYLLGLILIARQDLQGGANALREYIASAPAAPDVATARRELSRLETSIGK